jgi:hypothetical protein
MGLAEATALVVQADLVDFSGQADLASLEDDSEVDLDAVILKAHKDLYWRLYENGLTTTQLAAISNTARLADYEADLALARLDETLLGNPERAAERRTRAYEGIDRFRPVYATDQGAISRRSGEGVPSVAHASDGLVYGFPQNDSSRGDDYMRTNIPVDVG